MKKTAFIAALSVLMLATNSFANVVGFYNAPFLPGDNWFGNQLDNSVGNTLSVLFPTAPTGTTISLWNSTSDQFDTPSTWDGSHWSLNLTLNLGTGALLHTPSLFTNTFVGDVKNLDGSPLSIGSTLTNPPPFAGPNGVYFLSSKTPTALSGHTFNSPGGPYDVFTAIIGRAPNPGEQVTTFDPVTQTTHTSTFVGGVWSNGDPALSIGRAALFNLGPVIVPEPSTLALLFASIGTTAVIRSRRRSKA